MHESIGEYKVRFEVHFKVNFISFAFAFQFARSFFPFLKREALQLSFSKGEILRIITPLFSTALEYEAKGDEILSNSQF